MRISIAPLLLALASAVNAASWGFADGDVTVLSKGGGKTVEQFTSTHRVPNVLSLGHQDKLRVSLTTRDGSKAKRPHQAFLIIRESSGLEAPFPLTVKASGKGSVEITHKDLPVQLLVSQSPLEVSLVLGSFGTSQGSVTRLFDVSVRLDAGAAAPTYAAPLRYGRLEEIQHVFRADPKNPPRIVSLAFAAAVVGMVPCLFVGWGLLGANAAHARTALAGAPVSHVLFLASIVAMEGVFGMYYMRWRLFQTLPVIGVVGVGAFLSGTKALSEVRRRRLAGERPPIHFTTVEETLKHPAFPSAIWDLQPDEQGRLPVAATRGGPIHISWEIHGRGATKVALIIGLGSIKTSWQRQTKHFGHERGTSYSVLIVDNRGMGGSDKPLGRYSTSEMALDLLEVLDHVGWTRERQIHLAGISMGGMIAQELACRIPSRLASLSLLCTTASYEPAATSLLGRLANALSILSVRRPSEDDAIRESARRLFSDEYLAGADADADLLPVPGVTPACGPARGNPDGRYEVFASGFQRFQAQELTKRHTPGLWTLPGFLAQLTAANWHYKSPRQLSDMADAVGRDRILVMHGTRDSMISLPNGERLMELVKPRVALVVQGMGHVPLMERTHWLHGVLEEHFTACAQLAYNV